MSAPKLPLAGACRCGDLGIEITAAPFLTAACHCAGCRKMSASAFSLTAMVPAAGFAVTRGEPVVGGVRGPTLRHMFCPDCKTWAYTRIVGVEAFVNVRPTMFEDTAWFIPFIETCTAEKLPWAHVPARYSFDAFPDPSQYDELTAAYAAAHG
ncbi:GFA family protein [Oceanicella sp. SM1341]|uniref:GFA family protein n=1 Tax=Oceanicella sp. SM1341 TaxID=1548889 RepID=UPI000E50DF59|nr:GFA family protein [Oceanicella sp. SM1341]